MSWQSFMQVSRTQSKATKAFIKKVALLPEANRVTKAIGTATADLATIQYVCEECGKVCSFKQVPSVHVLCQHSTVEPVRRKLDDSSSCYACLLQFVCRPRFLEHLLQKSQLCKQFYVEHVQDVPAETFDMLEAHDREVGARNVRDGKRRNCGVAPCLRRVGPHPRLARQCITRHPLGPGQRWHSPMLDTFDNM